MAVRKIWTVRTIGTCEVQPPNVAIPAFRPPSHPAAKFVRERYDLDRIGGKGTDFARARRIKTWARKNWNHGFTRLKTPHTAANLLAAAKRGCGFLCSDYAQVVI